MNLNDLNDFIENEDLEDQTVSSGGGDFVRELLGLGKHPVRLVSYIELGVHDQKAYQGKEKPPAEEVQLTFQFLGKRDVKEREDGKGEYAPTKTFRLKKSYHEKAAFRKLFEKMRNGDTSIKNMAQMVGRMAWFVDVEYSQGRGDSEVIIKTKKQYEEAQARLDADPSNKELKIWDNIRNSEGFMLTAAMKAVTDEDGEETGDYEPVKVRDMIGNIQFFVWDKPKPQFWESIFIDGTYTRTVDGKEVEVSRNRFQETIMAANNYEGSPIQSMLEGTDNLAAGASLDDDGSSASDKAAESDEEPSNDSGSEIDELGL